MVSNKSQHVVYDLAVCGVKADVYFNYHEDDGFEVVAFEVGGQDIQSLLCEFAGWEDGPWHDVVLKAIRADAKRECEQVAADMADDLAADRALSGLCPLPLPLRDLTILAAV